MTSVLTFVMLIVGGVALVIQNTLMARITLSASTILIALVLNSAVGLVLLITLLAGKTGTSGFYELFQSFKGWMLLPGILGSFFCIYRNNGLSEYRCFADDCDTGRQSTCRRPRI